MDVSTHVAPQFQLERLDALLDDAGIDVLVASSKHNIQYLLGGHRHHFFDYMDAIGISRYLPILLYPKGRPQDAVYIAYRNEKDMLAVRDAEAGGLWVPTVLPAASSSAEAITLAITHLRRLGLNDARLGVEGAFLPHDAALMLQDAFPAHRLSEVHRALERLRAVKTPHELALLRQASERVVDSMLAVMSSNGPGTTKRALIESLRREETDRGLTFEYALVTVGTSMNRAPSDDQWREGDIMSIDSGANLHGYIGDLCRMAIQGEPDAELEDLLGEVDRIQQAARNAAAGGVSGGAVQAAAEAVLAASPHAASLHFVAHGMGLISHEAPRLTERGPVPYPASDAELPLLPGMILSIETTLQHKRRGFIKLEDTVAVTETGIEGFGDRGRGWNRG